MTRAERRRMTVRKPRRLTAATLTAAALALTPVQSSLILPPKKKIILPAPAIVKASNLEMTLGAVVFGTATARARKRDVEAGGSPPTLTYIDQLVDDSGGSSASSRTWTDFPIGTASGDRLVILCAGSRSGSTGRTIDAFTINGVSANFVTGGGVSNGAASIFYLLVTTGTTATLVSTCSGAMGGQQVAVYILTGYTSETPYHSNVATGGAATSRNTTLNIAAGGAAVAVCGVNNTATDHVYTGLNEQEDVANSSGRVSSASDSNMSAETGRAISLTHGNAGSTLAAASWI